MSDKKQLIKSVVTGSVCGLLITMLLNCVFAAVMLKTGLLPPDITSYAACGLLAAGTFAAGIVATKINKSAGLIVGLLTGAAIFLLVTVAGLIKSGETLGIMTIIKLASCLICGGLGGILGLKENKKIVIK